MESTRRAASGRRAATVMRYAAVLAMAFGWLGAVPRAAAQQDGLVGGDSYVSAEYGWSVEFDDRTWEADELDSSGYVGVRLSLEGVGFADVGVYADLEDTDAEECLEVLDAFYTGGDTWEDLEPARRLDLPETDRAAEAELYEGAIILDGEGVDAALYLECREVDGAALTVEFTALEGTYEDALPDLEDLLAGIDTDGASARDDDEPEGLGETDLDAGVYVGRQFGFRVEWNIDLWGDPEDIAEDGVEGREGIYLVAPGGGSAQIFSQDTTPDYGVDACLEDNVDGWGQMVPDLEEFTPDDGQEILWPRGSESAQAIGTLELEDGSEVEAVFSAACLELGDGEDYLIMALTSRAEGYEENAVAFNDILDSLTFAAASDDEPAADDDEPAADDDEPASDDDEPASDGDLGETDLEAGVFVGETIPFRVEWNTTTWEGTDQSDGDLEGVILVNGAGYIGEVFVLAAPSGYDTDRCLADTVDTWATVANDLEEIEQPDAADIPWPRGTELTHAAGEVEQADGSVVAAVFTAGCAEVADGEGFLVMRLIAPEDRAYFYATQFFAIVVESIQVGDASSPGGDRDDADTDEPTDDSDEPADEDVDVDAEDLGETDLEAGVYVGAIPYRVEWDPDDYEAMEAINGGAVILTATDDESVVISFTDQTNQDDVRTPQDCAESYASIYEDYEPYDPPASEEIDWPAGAGVVQLTGESGFDPSQERILQVACAEVIPGEAYVTITFGANEEDYEDRLEDFNDILGSFVVGR